MSRALGEDAIRRARLAAQLLHRPGRTGPGVVDVVARLLATQAQDIGAAPLAIRARSRGLTADDVAAARQNRSVVRTWGPRGTLHLVAADDLGWLTPLMLQPMLPTAIRRLAQEAVAGTPEELLATVERAMAGQGPLTKHQLADRLGRLGCPATGQGIVYLAYLAAIHGRAVLGPDRGNRPTYVHAAEWLGQAPVLERDRTRALAELVRRYLRAHAPAAPEDLAAWSGLPLRDTRAAWSSVAGELAEVEHRGRPLWRLRRARPSEARVPVALVPAFDEYLLGWRDRALIVDAAHARKVQPGGGIIRAAVLVDGRVAGTWRINGRAGPVVVDLFPGAAEDAGAPAVLAAETADVARFTGQAAPR